MGWVDDGASNTGVESLFFGSSAGPKLTEKDRLDMDESVLILGEYSSDLTEYAFPE